MNTKATKIKMRHTHKRESKELILKKLTKGSIFNSIGGDPCYQSERKVYICKILRKREKKRGGTRTVSITTLDKAFKAANITAFST